MIISSMVILQASTSDALLQLCSALIFIKISFINFIYQHVLKFPKWSYFLGIHSNTLFSHQSSSSYNMHYPLESPVVRYTLGIWFTVCCSRSLLFLYHILHSPIQGSWEGPKVFSKYSVLMNQPKFHMSNTWLPYKTSGLY